MKEYIDFEIPLQSYLFKSVYNRSVSYLGSRKHIGIQGNEDNVMLNLHKDFIPYNQQDNLLVEELRIEIFKYVEILPDKCKNIFKLSRLKGLKNKDIALKLGISEKTVESHMRKALKEIRDHLIRIGLLMSFLSITTCISWFLRAVLIKLGYLKIPHNFTRKVFSYNNSNLYFPHIIYCEKPISIILNVNPVVDNKPNTL